MRKSLLLVLAACGSIGQARAEAKNWMCVSTSNTKDRIVVSLTPGPDPARTPRRCALFVTSHVRDGLQSFETCETKAPENDVLEFSDHSVCNFSFDLKAHKLTKSCDYSAGGPVPPKPTYNCKSVELRKP